MASTTVSLTPAEGLILRRFVPGRFLSLTELADALGVSDGRWVVYPLTGLLQRGLVAGVQRVTGPHQGRAYRLTEAGERARNAAA